MSSKNGSVFYEDRLFELRKILSDRGDTSKGDRLKAFDEIANLLGWIDKVNKLGLEASTKGISYKEHCAVEAQFLRLLKEIERYARLVYRYSEEEVKKDYFAQIGKNVKWYDSLLIFGDNCSSIPDCAKDMLYRSNALQKLFPLQLTAKMVKITTDFCMYGLQF